MADVSLENTAGYIDSEHSEVEHGYKGGKRAPAGVYNRFSYGVASPKFGRDDLVGQHNGFPLGQKAPTRILQPHQSLKSMPSFPDSLGGGTPTSCRTDDTSCYSGTNTNHEFKWWCQQEESFDSSVPNSGTEVTPEISPFLTNKIVHRFTHENGNNGKGDQVDVLSGKTTAGSIISRQTSIADDEESGDWHSWMMSVDEIDELEHLRCQIIERLKVKVPVKPNLLHTRKPNTRPVEHRDAAVNTLESSSTEEYRQQEVQWLRQINELLKDKLLEVLPSRLVTREDIDWAFIESVQRHLIHVNKQVALLEAREDMAVPEELKLLRVENAELQKNLGESQNKVQELQDQIKQLTKAKDTLENDFKKTLTYMRLMKDRLKSLSEANVNVQHQRPVNKSVAVDKPRESAVRRSNTENLPKQNTVKFAESSDVYYLPKRSLSESRPLIVKPPERPQGFGKLLDLFKFNNETRV